MAAHRACSLYTSICPIVCLHGMGEAIASRAVPKASKGPGPGGYRAHAVFNCCMLGISRVMCGASRHLMNTWDESISQVCTSPLADKRVN